MTKDRIDVLAYKVMEQHKGDKQSAMRALALASDELFARGKYELAERAEKVLAFIRVNY